MKRILTYISISLSTIYGQFDLYPVSDFFGGGIGYSPMYINIDKFPATNLLKNVGLNPSSFDAPFVVHGGEGFAHVTGRWRIGGYAGMGASSVSTIPDIVLYKDSGTPGYDIEDTSLVYTDDFNPSIKAKFSDPSKRFSKIFILYF